MVFIEATSNVSLAYHSKCSLKNLYIYHPTDFTLPPQGNFCLQLLNLRIKYMSLALTKG